MHVRKSSSAAAAEPMAIDTVLAMVAAGTMDAEEAQKRLQGAWGAQEDACKR